MFVDAPLTYVRGYGYDTTTGTIVRDDRRSKAMRSRTDSGNFARSTLHSRVDNFASLVGLEHPDDSGLMIHSIGATIVRGRPAQFDAHYRPKPLENGEASGDIIELRWYKDTDGTIIPVTDEPNFRVRRIPIWHINFRHYYYQTNAPSVNEANVDTTNNDTYTISGFGTFSANELRYNPFDVEWIREGNTSIWAVDYSFTYRADGWVEQRVTNNTPGNRQIATKDMYERSAFPDIP